MQALVLIMIVVVTTFRFLRSEDLLPGFAPYAVEALSAFVLLYVVAVGVQTGFRYVRPAYWFAFAAIGICVLCGILVNQVEIGPIIAGLRMYLRPIPFFFLPAVFLFKERHVRTQLLLLIGICAIQLPLAYDQRMAHLAKGGATGDTTYGTLMISSILSIFLICAISLLLAMYLRKEIALWKAALLFLVLVLPTTINETKGTLFLLPVAVIVTFMTGARPGTRIKSLLVGLGVLATFAAVFIPIYNQLIQHRRYPTTIAEFFTTEGRLESYIGTGEAQVGTTEPTGRLDTIVGPLRFLSREPTQLVFGLGIGNATESSLGRNFTGAYFHLLEPFLFTTFAMLVTELGLTGLGLALLAMFLIYKDARIVASRGSGLVSALALGWTGVTAVYAAGFVYKDLIPHESLSCLFWFFGGMIAAERMKIDLAAREAAEAAALDRRLRRT